MEIKKEHLDTLWFEDENGEKLEYLGFDAGMPEGAVYQVSRFPNILNTKHLRLTDQKEVDKCKHPRKHVVPTYGWIDGIVGRRCNVCGGTQTKRKWRLWPKKWDGHGSRVAFSCDSSWSEDLVLAIVNSGDYTLKEAIIIAATACERCMNALAHKYGLKWGYPEYGEEWKETGTVCQFCKGE